MTRVPLAVVTVCSALVVILAVGALVVMGTKTVPDNGQDQTMALKVCDGLALLRKPDGTIWLRVSRYRAYRIDGDWRTFC
jgi:hypothetical protein